MTGASRNAGSKPRLMLANRAIAMKTSRLLASRKMSDAGIFDVCGQVESGRRQVARPLDRASAARSCLRATTAILARSLLRVARSCVVDFAARRVQLGGQLRTRPAPGRTCRSRRAGGRAGSDPARRAAWRARAPSRAFGVVGLAAERLACIRRRRGRSPDAARRRGRGAAPPRRRSRRPGAASSHERASEAARQRRDESLTTSTPRGGS